MDYSDLKTENEIKLWSENRYLKRWLIIPLVLVVLYLIYIIITTDHCLRCNEFNGMTQEEINAYNAVMDSRP